MEINIPVDQDLLLMITDKPSGRAIYPTSQLQKGLKLAYRGLDLAEEAVGFGLPVLKRGFQTFFPGGVALDCLHSGSAWLITADYTINQVEKMIKPNGGRVTNALVYGVKNSMAAFIRQFPPWRGILMALSGKLRRTFGWKTAYAQADFSARIKMIYRYEEKTKNLTIEADQTGVPQGSVSEVIIMNEQGAHYFDMYRDSSGIMLSGEEIGCWDEVSAAQASFVCPTHRINFTLLQVAGARLYRGRELVDTRLAWSGFGYSFPATIGRFRYEMKIEKLS